MATTIVARYRRWFEYEQDVHAKVFDSLATVPADNRDGAEYRKAVSLLSHIVAARQVWLFRLGSWPTAPTVLFPENQAVEAVAAEWRATAGAWNDYLNRIDDAELDGVFEYQSLDSRRFRNRVEDILTQMFGHSWYHRGQVAVLVKAAGGTPAMTDFVFWCREPVAATQA
jgi:uncharacterized damage-inducible protein DinB